MSNILKYSNGLKNSIELVKSCVKPVVVMMMGITPSQRDRIRVSQEVFTLAVL